MNDVSITVASIEDHEESIIDVREERHPDCCIYRVPKTLRKINEEAYTPKVISIGPLHHGKDEFADMEKQKIRYKREFVKRVTPRKWQLLITYIEVMEQRIRSCYAERSELRKHEFVRMILYDAVFIIELFLRYFDLMRNKKRDILLDVVRIGVDIKSDLQLLENQIPFFVLNDLYRLASPSTESYILDRNIHSFLDLSREFFQLSSLSSFNPTPAEMGVKHFIDLRRSLLTQFVTSPPDRYVFWFKGLPGAVELRELGLKFNGTERETFLDIKFVDKTRSCQLGDDPELQIPRIEVDDQTEILMRNLMALEQCHYPGETMVCNYVDLMDTLINTAEDVNLLTEQGILSNNLGENARIATMFKKLCQEICFSESRYGYILFCLKYQYDHPTKVKLDCPALKKVYFSSLWRGTATVAAVVLLVLTTIQTICSILSVIR